MSGVQPGDHLNRKKNRTVLKITFLGQDCAIPIILNIT